MNDEIKKLEEIIKTLDTLYHKGDDCVHPYTLEIISDNQYDALRKKLFDLCPNSKIFNTITAEDAQNNKNRIVHSPPMTSINKCNGSKIEKKNILDKWIKDCGQIEEDSDYSMNYKLDGIALSLNYKNGILQSAGLRSKSGIDGQDITDKTEYIEGILQQLPLNINCTIRGEVLTPISVFEEKNKELEEKNEKTYSNARAYSAGALNHKTISKMKDKGLRFVAYNILNFKDAPYKTEIERAKWAENKLKIDFVKTISFDRKTLEILEENHKKLDYMIDGCVLSVNNLEMQEKLGKTGNRENGNPKGKIAFKFADEVKKTVVKDIIWQTGRVGSISPVLILKPIELEGTCVKRCTAHNLGLLLENRIGMGSEIEIIKSGKIIPKIHKVITTSEELNIPEHCPSCGSPTEIKDGNNDSKSLVCNNIDCPAQNIKTFDHYFKSLNIKGIDEKGI